MREGCFGSQFTVESKCHLVPGWDNMTGEHGRGETGHRVAGRKWQPSFSFPFYFIQTACLLVGATPTRLFSKFINHIQNYAKPTSGSTQYHAPMSPSLPKAPRSAWDSRRTSRSEPYQCIRAYYAGALVDFTYQVLVVLLQSFAASCILYFCASASQASLDLADIKETCILDLAPH